MYILVKQISLLVKQVFLLNVDEIVILDVMHHDLNHYFDCLSQYHFVPNCFKLLVSKNHDFSAIAL